MSEVKRWYIAVYDGEAQARVCAPHQHEFIRDTEGEIFVLAEQFDACEARNRALQQDLNQRDEQIATLDLQREAHLRNSQVAERRVGVLEQEVERLGRVTMTTNQTIDGVPRELRALLERVVGNASQTPHWDALDEDRIAASAELRALLDATELQYDGFTAAQAHAVSAGVDELLFGKPADQPQGDTVPVSAHWSDWSMVTLEIEGKHRTYVEFCKPLQKPVAWKTGSITWAYEPDALRHGDQYGVLVKPLYDRPDCREPDYYRIKTPKTLVNGVPTEWFPAVMFYAKSELPKDGMYRVIERLYAEQPAPVAVVMPDRFKEVMSYLLGEDDLDGHLFRDPHKDGMYWWRRELRACLDDLKRLTPSL